MQISASSSFRLLALAGAATLALGFTAPSAQAQTMYSMGATGTTGSTGNAGATGAAGGTGGPGLPALDLMGASMSMITAGTYTGGRGGAGGTGGPAEPPDSMGQFTPAGNGGRGGTGAAAVQAESGSTVTIMGGTFNFGLGGAGGAPSQLNNFGQPASSGSVGANGYTLLDNGGAITLFGTFTGGPQTITTPATGTFTGTLTGDTAAQTFSYDITAGSITLATSPAPEPGTWAALALGGALLGGVTLRRRVRAV